MPTSTAAAAVAVKARFINAGQSCVNAKRFIVEDGIADRFVATFVDGVRKLKIGNPMDRDTQIGPMARANLRSDLHDQVERTLAAGATLKLGGRPTRGRASPTSLPVIDHVGPNMVDLSRGDLWPGSRDHSCPGRAGGGRAREPNGIRTGCRVVDRRLDRAAGRAQH